MASQTNDLHRALLRPAVIHTLRAAGFHSTRPSVLDALTNIAERYLLLLATTTARQAASSHNDPVPTISDVRMALTECGALTPVMLAGEEGWKEALRRPIEGSRGDKRAGVGEPADRQRRAGEKRKRDADDVVDVSEFAAWFDGAAHAEIRRVAGIGPEAAASAAGGLVGVGGGLMHGEDFLAHLKKKYAKAGAGAAVEDGRLAGTVLGREVEEKEVWIDGGPVKKIFDWKPPLPSPPSPSMQRGISDGLKGEKKRDGVEETDEGYETAVKTDTGPTADDDSEDERPLKELAAAA